MTDLANWMHRRLMAYATFHGTVKGVVDMLEDRTLTADRAQSIIQSALTKLEEELQSADDE